MKQPTQLQQINFPRFLFVENFNQKSKCFSLSSFSFAFLIHLKLESRKVDGFVIIPSAFLDY